MNILFVLFSLSLLYSEQTESYRDTSGDPVIIEKLISYTEERKQLSIDYLKNRHGINQANANIAPTMIVLHYTGKGTVKSIYNYFNQAIIENAREINKKESRLNVSSHYLVDRDGTIFRLVPDTLFCRHTIGLNYCAIGIENIGSKEQPLTKAQIKSNAQLVRYLKSKYDIQYVIGHSEYVRFRYSYLWKETNKHYFTQKEDPGDQFLKEVRQLISDLSCKYSP